MRIIILFPLILFVGLIVFNMNLFDAYETINLYGFSDVEVPALFYLSVFLVIYTIFIILFFDSVLIFSNRKIRKLDKEGFELKSKLYDEREDELVVFLTEQKQRFDNFMKNQQELFEKLKTDTESVVSKLELENETSLTKQKADSDRILEKIGLLDEGLISKIRKTLKGK